MTFIVTLNHNGSTYYLRSTIWAWSEDRATVYATKEEAQAGLDKAKQFMKAKQYKSSQITEQSPV